jgi:oligopeptide/dipeptide ABC transporter ATP-binding protein
VTASGDEILRIEDVHVAFPVRQPNSRTKVMLRAVDGVSLAIPRGETFAVVGESGCGKTTLARTVLGLQKPTSGRVLLHGEDLTAMTPRQLRAVRPKLQVVFQDPYSSLNPRMTVHDIIAEPLRINGRYRPERVDELLELVSMTPEIKTRRPSQFSGGQRQRIGIARALALDPEILVLDEPVSSLDVSIQAQVINILTRLQKELGLTCLLISHDLSVVRYMSQQVAVMYLGKVVEVGPRQQIFEAPHHPYTHSLLSAVPVPRPEGRDQRRRRTMGELPDPTAPPSGCSFRTRCPRAKDVCAEKTPPLEPHGDGGHPSACWFAGPPEGAERPWALAGSGAAQRTQS